MASISVSKYGAYIVRWRDSNKASHQKNFKTKAEAKNFIKILEMNPQDYAKKVRARDYFADYRDRISSKKRGAKQEILRINNIMERPFANKALADIRPLDIEKYFEERMQEPSLKTGGKISPATVIKEAHLLSAIFNRAVREGLIKENPVRDAKKPKEPEHRERVATEKDIELLLIASGWDGESVPLTEMSLVMAMFLFACKTGMRSGEILKIKESWIDGRVIHLPAAAIKTNTKRDVALSKEAIRILDLVRQRGDGEEIFSGTRSDSRDSLWRKIRDRAGLGIQKDSDGNVIKEGLNFHDSRATFCTWAASINPKTGAPRLPVQTLARQTGHRNIKMLMRYYRPTGEQIADYLDAD